MRPIDFMRIGGLLQLPVYPYLRGPECPASRIFINKDKTLAPDVHLKAVLAGIGRMHPVVRKLRRPVCMIVQLRHLQIRVGVRKTAGINAGDAIAIPAIEQLRSEEVISDQRRLFIRQVLLVEGERSVTSNNQSKQSAITRWPALVG